MIDTYSWLTIMLFHECLQGLSANQNVDNLHGLNESKVSSWLKQIPRGNSLISSSPRRIAGRDNFGTKMQTGNLNPQIRYPATLRDADNQILSNGEVLIDTSQASGYFWPENKAILNTLPVHKAIIEMHQPDLILEIYFLRPCAFQLYLHFDLVK